MIPPPPTSPPCPYTSLFRSVIDAIRDLNLKRLVETGDPEISTRISAYEMAYRMQSSAPELINLSGWRFPGRRFQLDRKSTRLNSSHLGISYAVFCLEKKNQR